MFSRLWTFLVTKSPDPTHDPYIAFESYSFLNLELNELFPLPLSYSKWPWLILVELCFWQCSLPSDQALKRDGEPTYGPFLTVKVDTLLKEIEQHLLKWSIWTVNILPASVTSPFCSIPRLLGSPRNTTTWLHQPRDTVITHISLQRQCNQTKAS